MKKLFTLAVVAATMMFSQTANAQVQFGVKAGVNLSSISMSHDEDAIDASNRTGFFAGVTADVTIPLAGLGADIALLYDNKVIGVVEDGNEANKTLHYVSLPINAKYTIGLSSIASVYFATGPQFSWNVGDRNWRLSNYKGFDDDWELKKSEFSWNVGCGVTALSHVRVGYNYNIGIGKTAETTFLNTAGQAVKGKLRNNTHQISLTYLF